MTFLSGLVVHALFFGFLTAWLAERKQYSARSWFLLGALFGVVATFLLYLQPARSDADASATAPR